MPLLNAHSAKQDEMNALRAFAAQCQPGSYLHTFFSTALLHWVEEAIGDDTSPDLMGALLEYRRQALAASQCAQSLQTQLATQAHELDVQVRQAQVQAVLAAEHSAQLGVELDATNQALAQARSAVVRLQQDLDEAHELCERHIALIAAQQLELFELKAGGNHATEISHSACRLGIGSSG